MQNFTQEELKNIIALVNSGTVKVEYAKVATNILDKINSYITTEVPVVSQETEPAS